MIGGVTDDPTGGERRVWASTGVPGPGLRLSCPRKGPSRLRPLENEIAEARRDARDDRCRCIPSACYIHGGGRGHTLVFSIWKDEEKEF